MFFLSIRLLHTKFIDPRDFEGLFCMQLHTSNYSFGTLNSYNAIQIYTVLHSTVTFQTFRGACSIRPRNLLYSVAFEFIGCPRLV